ncbi:ROK family protein [Geobacter sp.]|uniref:ROK family protein n=1 Tax=Geobacter sp. TaxID=46610 RepID=UPI0027B978A6|nr:ROK family protein [Geobacter sp.]
MDEISDRAYIGIDVGGTNLRMALVDEQGVIIHKTKSRTEIHHGRQAFFSLLGRGIESLLRIARDNGRETVAVGVGVPGLIANNGHVHVSVNLPPLDGLNLRDELQAMTGLPTVVANDVNAFAFGESVYGAGRGYRSFLMVTLGTGVGGGLILDGKIWTGIDGVAGEFGHMTVEPEGKPCPCGNHGCLEQYASASALVTAAREVMSRQGSILLAGHRLDGITTKMVADAAREGNPTALSLFAEAGRYLGIAAASVANLLNLEALIIGGGVAASFDLLQESIEREILGRAFPIPGRRLRIDRATLGDDGGFLGSAALVMNHYQKGNP